VLPEILNPEFPDIINTRPLRFWVDDGLEWVVRNWGDGFEAAASPLLLLLNSIERFLLATPWWLIIIVLTGLAFASTRRPALAIVVFVSLIFLGLMELWQDSIKTMALMIAATLTAISFAIPIGIVMSRSPTVRRLVTPVLDLMQTLPSFVYLIPAVMIFGPGKIPALLATIIYAAPPLIRLTDLGLRLVDRDILEAAHAFGAKPPTPPRARDVGHPPTSRGRGGRAYQVFQGIGRLEVSRGLFAGLGIVVLAIVFDRISQGFGKQLQTRIGLAETRL